MRKLQTLLLLFFMTSTMVLGQKIILDGYVFEENNRGFLNEVKVTVLDVTGVLVGETQSDMDGHFVYDGVDAGKEYIVQYEKKIFQTIRDTFSTVGKKAGDKIFLKKQIERQPGYLLEVTLAEKRVSAEIATDGINGCRIEVFNVTKNKEELVIDSAKTNIFSVTLQQGNQYTVMIRKKGFFTKRMDANVNINGCYLCMDGFGSVNPGVTSNLTSSKDNTIGTLLSNIELDRIDMDRNIVIQNIYYASASADLTLEARKELDKVISLMKNNPALIIELGSHTDSRGGEAANQKLSQDRAQAAVNYITASGWIESSRVKAKGYGESRLTNKCEDGTPCSDEEHIKNRRTELKVIGLGKDAHEGLSLAEIIHQEEMMKFVLSGESDKQYSAPANGTPTPQPKVNQTQIDTEKATFDSKVPPSPNNRDASTVKKVEKTVQIEVDTEKATFDSNPPSVKKAETTIKQLESGAKPPVVTSKKPATTTPAPTKTQTPPAVKQERSVAPKPNNVPQTPAATTQIKVEPLEDAIKTAETPKTTAVAVVAPKENVKVNLSAVEKTFVGYKIEIFTSKTELALEDPDLKMVALDVSSDIQIDKLKDGQTSYMVGSFSNWGETERFLEKVQAKYPKAQIVDYFNGKRVGQ